MVMSDGWMDGGWTDGWTDGWWLLLPTVYMLLMLLRDISTKAKVIIYMLYFFTIIKLNVGTQYKITEPLRENMGNFLMTWELAEFIDLILKHE